MSSLPLQYPTASAGSGVYESVYCALVDPERPRALWVRTTVAKKPGADPTGAVWVTWFDESGVRAGKLTDVLPSPDGDGLACGPARQGPAGSRGALALDSLRATWDVSFTPRSQPLRHLHPAFLYGAPFPRTKATSPLPELDVSGSLTVDGTDVDLTGWSGMLGHNWGTEHAARWIWLRACGLGTDGSGWLDVVLGRVRIGPALLSWTGFGALELAGRRHVLGGLLSRGTHVELRPDGATCTLRGPGVKVECVTTVQLPATVGWEYADPSGHRHEVVNSSVASHVVTLTVDGKVQTLRPTRRGVLEVGGDERAWDVQLQPFKD